MSERETTIAMEFTRLAYMMSGNFKRDNVKPDRITISFPSIGELYSFTKALRYGVRDMYAPPNNEPGDWLRDETGLLYSDWTLYGLDFRFTTPVRTTGYPVEQPEPEFDDGGMAEERKRHP